MEINARLVKQLRDKTGAGMMDCKRALVENDGNIEAAAEHLRKKGLMDAAKKSSRTAADGLVAFAVSDDKKTAAIVELNAETDFVAKNDKFQVMASTIASIALTKSNIEEVLQEKYPGTSHTVNDEINSLISLVGENMTLRRVEKVSVSNGAIAAYAHNAVSPTMGKIGVLIAIDSDSNDVERLLDLGKKIAMHTAAANPTYLSTKCVPQTVVDKEKSIILEQAKEMGKAIEIAEKMAEGRISKFFEEIVLYEQPFVIDSKLKIKEVVANLGKEIESDIKLVNFVKYVLGEGIEKAETNFADEVMSFVK